MTSQSFHDDYAAAKRDTKTQVKSRAVRSARARARFERLIQLGADGYTIEEAAAALGVTVAGVKANAFNHAGTTLWPISGDAS